MSLLKEIKQIGNRGGALVMSFIVMVLLCYASASLVQVRSSDLTQSTDHIQKSKSSYIAMAGIEYAKYRVNMGADPSIVGKTFADGQFDISKDFTAGQIKVAGRMGRAETEQTIDIDFASKCFAIDPLYDINFGPVGGGIYNLKFKKTCHDRVIIDKISISWPSATSAQKIMKVISENHVAVYDAANTPKIGTPTSGAQSGVDIDIKDVALSDNMNHFFEAIVFDYPSGSQPPRPETFIVKFIFQDGSGTTFNCSW